MPKDFLRCIKSKGKVVTKKIKGGKYIHLCKTKSGKWTKGEVKVKRKRKK